jgi:TonB family protein
MKKMFYLSVAFHVVMIGSLYGVSLMRSIQAKSIYQVGLVSMPAVPVHKTPPAPHRKAVQPPPPPPKAKPAPPKPKAVKPPPKAKPVPVKPAPSPKAVPELSKPKPERAETPPPVPAETPASPPETAPSGEASVAEPSTPAISANVDLPNFEFPYYLKLVQGKIGSFWSPPDVGAADASLEVVIAFRLDASGKVTEVVVEKRSGNNYFDQAAMRAVYMANPLPPLPKGFTDPDLKIHFSFLLGKSG